MRANGDVGGGAETPEDLREGDRCEGNFKGRGRWYPGKISRMHSDGTYTLDYDDGEQERRVEKPNMRPIARDTHRHPLSVAE